MFRAGGSPPDARAAYTLSYEKGKVGGASRCRHCGLNCCNLGRFSEGLTCNKFMHQHEISKQAGSLELKLQGASLL